MIRTIDLSGEWEFSFEEPRCDDTITLPGTTAMAKKGQWNPKEETGFLTECYPYEGKAYFAKRISIPKEDIGKHIILYLERTRMTRVWVDETPVGGENSLTAPQEFDLTDYVRTEEICLKIEVANCGYPTAGGHMTSPDTQTNWLGIMGRIALDIYDDVFVRNVYAVGNIADRAMELTCTVVNRGNTSADCTIRIFPERMYLAGLIGAEGKNYAAVPEKLTLKRERMEEQSARYCLEPGESRVRFVYHFSTEQKDRSTEQKDRSTEQDCSTEQKDCSTEQDCSVENVLWSEYTPVVLQFHGEITAQAGAETFSCYAGLRAFTAQGHDFCINGSPVKLRGTHDGLLFPLTGAAPMDLESWLRVMGTAWQYGINHYRYHTACPPEAAFLAADLLGIYMEPELPFWGTVAAEGEEGFHREEQEYLIQEGIRMMEAYGNHPSFCMMSLGNELWGSRERLNDILRLLKEKDNRFLYTSGSNNFQFVPEILPEEDFFVGARLAPADENGENKRLIRGSFATCDAPLGRVQTTEPGTDYDFDAAVVPDAAAEADADYDFDAAVVSDAGTVDVGTKNVQEDDSGQSVQQIAIQYGTGVKLVNAGEAEQNHAGIAPRIPVVSHEIGQYCMFPDFREIETYTGVLRASNMEIFRRRLAEKGMADRAGDFFWNAGRFAVECYREELEMMHRSRYIAGYQLLDIKDYTGQGTALVGILNAQMKTKGLVEPETWRTFASYEVQLAAFQTYIYTEGEPFCAQLKLSCFNPLLALDGKEVCWQLSSEAEKNKILREGALPIKGWHPGTFVVGKLAGEMPGYGELAAVDNDARARQRLTNSLRLPGKHIRKEYKWWLYPENRDIAPQIPVTSDAGRAWELLMQGGSVLYFPETLIESIPGFYCTDFWNYTMFRQISESMGKPVAVGTLGLCVQNGHPALAEFASETFSTPQWYHIVSNSRCAVLDEKMSCSYRPIVQMIDNVERNHKLGILFEAAAGNGGRLLVCTASKKALEQRPEGRQFLSSILHYVQSKAFAPAEEMTREHFVELFGNGSLEAKADKTLDIS